MNGERIGGKNMRSIRRSCLQVPQHGTSGLGLRTESSAQDAILRRMKDTPLLNESFTDLTFTKVGSECFEQSGCQGAVKPLVFQVFLLLSSNVQQMLLVIPSPVLSICQSHCGTVGLAWCFQGGAGQGTCVLLLLEIRTVPKCSEILRNKGLDMLGLSRSLAEA